MKHYAIFQLNVSKVGEEKRFLVGFQKAKDKEEAMFKHTDSEFKRGYLTAYECSEEQTKNPDLLKAIKNNIKKIGVWG